MTYRRIAVSKVYEYIIAFLIIIFSSSASAFANSDIWLVIVLFIVTFIYFLKKNYLGKSLQYPIVFLFICAAIEFIFYRDIILTAYIRIFVRVFIIYFSFGIVSNFWQVFEKTVFKLVIISLVIFPLQVAFFPTVNSILIAIQNILHTNQYNAAIAQNIPIRSVNILIYTIHHTSYESESFMRNSGFMWEPGAFALMILLAMIILYLHQEISRRNIHRYILYVIALITTFSTSGFIAFFILLFSVNLFSYRSKVINIFIFLPIILLLGSYVLRFPFMREKITTELYQYKNRIENSYKYSDRDMVSLGRFGSLYAGLISVKTNPITGLGLNDDRLYSSKYVRYNWTSGLADYLVKFGFLGIILLFYNVRKTLFVIGANRFKKHLFTWFTIALFVLFFSNTVLLYPLFIGLQIYYLKYIHIKRKMKSLNNA